MNSTFADITKACDLKYQYSIIAEKLEFKSEYQNLDVDTAKFVVCNHEEINTELYKICSEYLDIWSNRNG